MQVMYHLFSKNPIPSKHKLTHYSCCFQWLLGALLKAEYLQIAHIAITVADTFESRVLVHYNWCWGPL